MSTVPMFAFPDAMIMGNENFQRGRALGLILGLTGVLVLIGPEVSLPGATGIGFVFLGLVASFFYGFEGNYVAKYGTQGIDPRPPWFAPDFALIFSSILHVIVYTGYVWLVGRTAKHLVLRRSFNHAIRNVYGCAPAANCDNRIKRDAMCKKL